MGRASFAFQEFVFIGKEREEVNGKEKMEGGKFVEEPERLDS
jgi:hypothetical protein